MMKIMIKHMIAYDYIVFFLGVIINDAQDDEYCDQRIRFGEGFIKKATKVLANRAKAFKVSPASET